MRLSLKQKQVLGVTVMVALIVIALSLLHLITTAGVLLAESRDRFELFGSARLLAGGERDYLARNRLPRRAHQPLRAVGAAIRLVFARRRRRGHRRSDRHVIASSEPGASRQDRRARVRS